MNESNDEEVLEHITKLLGNRLRLMPGTPPLDHQTLKGLVRRMKMETFPLVEIKILSASKEVVTMQVTVPFRIRLQGEA